MNRSVLTLAPALCAAGAVAALAAAPAQASTASGSLTVSALVTNACGVSNAVLNFGSVSPSAGAHLSASTNILVTCTLGTSYSVSLGDGLYVTAGQRRMKGSVANGYLSYELYQDAAGATRFGSTTGQTVTGLSGLGNAANSIPVYGSVLSGQSAQADAYADTVPITVTY